MIGLILIPLIVGGLAFYLLRTITWKEFLLQIGSSVALLVGVYFVAKWGALQDTEYLNGVITKKAKGTESCCHCHTVCDSRDKDGNCTASHEVCSHFHDYWWSLKTTVGTIGVKDCSGSSSTPGVWKNAVVGEPATVAHRYTNYLLADKDSIVRHDVIDEFGKQIPNFPGVRNLYKRNPVVSDGVKIPADWQKLFGEMNARLGSKKQVDVVVLLTKETSPTYAQAVETKWLYGPKNAFTVVIGTDGNKVRWARAVTISKVSDLKIKIRDELEGAELSTVPGIVDALVGRHFNRTPMSDFEYLNKSTTLPTGWMIALYILAFLLSIGITITMHVKDVFGDEGFRKRRYR
jgi:hypothetical protein